ncbi:DUF2218 domain-containing protein [Shimia sp. R9_1]|uniref:DUF2218 domain-containing protein n=1 Tax=Shimia sp. R9_1 TaxID=2821111 RepID=UPI001ADB782B|nr:DUF2218 domain-containing protein [Shimia sp. R9_1]MBO9409612.1 DUF2218 domain-containing protein [Shimia sp. R9_1]
MRKQNGRFETLHARKYLQQLGKHFAHKVEVSFSETYCCVSFPFGQATISASETALDVSLSGETEEALSRGRLVIDSHLKRFAFREAFEEMKWQEL